MNHRVLVCYSLFCFLSGMRLTCWETGLLSWLRGSCAALDPPSSSRAGILAATPSCFLPIHVQIYFPVLLVRDTYTDDCSLSPLCPYPARYGVGYHMVVVKERSCDSAKVNGIVTSLVPGGKNITDVGTELSFILPSNSSEHFPQLFDKLEGKSAPTNIHVHACAFTLFYCNCLYTVAHKDELGIAGFGISVTTMEEVFIKVGEGTDESLEHRYLRT